MRYENLEKIAERYDILASNLECDIKNNYSLLLVRNNAVDRFIYSEIKAFCEFKHSQIIKAYNNGIDEYNGGNNAAESGVKYPSFLEYVEKLQKDAKYWREEWSNDFDKLKYYNKLHEKLQELSNDAAEIISRLEAELKAQREKADFYNQKAMEYFSKNFKLEEELQILRGEISEDGIERY